MARPLNTSGVSQISVVTTGEAEEPIAALLERIYGTSPSIYSNAETKESIVTLYARATPAALRDQSDEVREGIGALKEMGLATGSGEILIQKVKREDWSESWKKHFKTIKIGSALMIKPSWSKETPKPGQAVVVLDPGLSFGTGQHATTSFCLRQLVEVARRKSPTPRSMLDMGSGSGILAISAAKLGYTPVEAFDFDPVAVKISQKNCRTNRVDKKVTITRKDLTKMPRGSRPKFDLVCANIISPLLIAERDKILNRLAPSGTLVLAGILATEFVTVQKAYEEAGLRLVKSKVEREWQSGAFRWVG